MSCVEARTTVVGTLLFFVQWSELHLFDILFQKEFVLIKILCQKLTESHQLCLDPACFIGVVQNGCKLYHNGWMKCEEQEVEECNWNRWELQLAHRANWKMWLEIILERYVRVKLWKVLNVKLKKWKSRINILNSRGPLKFFSGSVFRVHRG